MGSPERSSQFGSEQELSDVIKIMELIRDYQEHGHEHAKLDPLNREPEAQHGSHQINLADILHHSNYGFSDKDLDREFFLDHPDQMGFLAQKKRWKLRDLIDGLKQAYCSSIGVEYLHCQTTEEKNWIRE